MNEISENNATFINNVCRICLNTTKLSSMPNELMKWYLNLVEEAVYQEYAMKICMICRWMLHKFSKFKKKCLMANHMLNGVIHVGLKISSDDKLRTSHGMDQTKPVTLSCTPPFDDTFHIETYSIHTHNTLKNVKHIASYKKSNIYNKESNNEHNNECFVDTLDYDTENDKYRHENENFKDENDRYINKNEKYTNEDDKYIDENDLMNDSNNIYEDNTLDRDAEDVKYIHESYKYIDENDRYMNKNEKYTNEDENDLMNDEDEDEIPLVMIRSVGKIKTKKENMKKKVVNVMTSPNKSEISQASVKGKKNEIQIKNKVKSKKNKKMLRDGFSSRMVQETSEYVVIKLTKQEVLQDMSERGKTEAYVSSPYKCAKCVKGFNFQDVLLAHMEKHSTKNGIFMCDICEQYCPSAVSLRGHIKSHTTRYKCKICGTVRVSRQHLMEHHAAHLGAAPRYQCLQCTFTTDKRTVMQRHARSHSQGERHACDQCGKLFKNIHYLRLHTARHDKSSRYTCPHCPATFLYHSLVRAHVRRAHERREFYCVECDVHFKCAESLRMHFKKAKRHRDASTANYSCTQCESSFPCARSLSAHLTTHGATKQHACQQCNSTYRTKDALRGHIWRVHKRGHTAAVCPHCHGTFARKSLLKEHLTTQGGGACGEREHTIHDKTQKEDSHYEIKMEV